MTEPKSTDRSALVGRLRDEPKRPFERNIHLSSSDLNTLLEWLLANADPALVIGGDYTVANLTDDLSSMLDGMWSDGIDAMGDDA